MSADTIGDFLTIIRNGLMRSKPFIVAPYSTLREAIVRILKEEGFIRDYSIEGEEGGKKSIKLVLKYVGSESVIHEIDRVSKPGRRQYAKAKKKGARGIRPVVGGLGLSILTTNKGVISNKKAKELGVGGEVICTVW